MQTHCACNVYTGILNLMQKKTKDLKDMLSAKIKKVSKSYVYFDNKFKQSKSYVWIISGSSDIIKLPNIIILYFLYLYIRK